MSQANCATDGSPIEVYFRKASHAGLEKRLTALFPDAARRDAQRPVYVERLEFEEWEIAFLGHLEGAHCIPDDLRPEFIECDTVPPGLSAIALRWRALDSVIELMPAHGIDGPLSPSDWLTIFSWIAHPLLRSSRPLCAWPPLLHAQPAAPRAAAECRG